MENLQVHELRIGNLLHDNKDRLCQVEEIFKYLLSSFKYCPFYMFQFFRDYEFVYSF